MLASLRLKVGGTGFPGSPLNFYPASCCTFNDLLPSMARTRTYNENTVPIRRAALSDSKRRERRERFQDLKNDLATTHNIFAASAREIAKKYGR